MRQNHCHAYTRGSVPLALGLLLLLWSGIPAIGQGSTKLAASPTSAASRWSTQNGTVAFRSNAPLELIEAESSALRGLLDADGRFAFVLPMNSFQGFNSGLQREHFQENYMETTRFPKATFEGRMIDPPVWPLRGPASVRVRGTLTVHGVERERIIQVQLQPDGAGGLQAEATFSVRLDDHGIGIPKIMHQKIADTISVTVQLSLLPDA